MLAAAIQMTASQIAATTATAAKQRRKLEESKPRSLAAEKLVA
jgi:hypothetical protein